MFSSLVLCGLLQVSFSIPIPQARKVPPDISLLGYTETDSFNLAAPDKTLLLQNQFRNDFIFKNQSDYVISDAVNSIVLECKAKYPITWSFPDSKSLPYTFIAHLRSAEYRSSIFTPNLEEPNNVLFTSYLVFAIQIFTFFSTNFTCQSVELGTQLQSSIYVYLDGKDDIENQGKTVNISYSPGQKSPLIIPCRPSSPSTNLLLEQQLNPGSPQEKWITVPVSSPWNFNPKIGFSVPAARVTHDFRARSVLYRCSLLTGDQDNDVADTPKYTFFKVGGPSNSSDDQSVAFEPNLSLQGSARISVIVKETKGLLQPKNTTAIFHQTVVQCCTGIPEKPPLIEGFHCLSRLSCQLYKKHLPKAIFNPQLQRALGLVNRKKPLPPAPNPEGCADFMLYFSSQVISCEGDNINVKAEYKNLFHSSSFGPVTNRSQRLPPAPQNVSQSLTGFSDDSVAELPVTRKMMIFVSRRINGLTVTQSNTAKLGAATIFTQDGSLVSVLKRAKADGASAMINFRKRSTLLVEYDRDVYYEGEPLLFLCVGVKSLYSSGSHHLRLNWKNGSRSGLDQGPDSDVAIPQKNLVQLFYLSGGESMFAGSLWGAAYVFGKTVKADLNMKSVDCWMPVAESAKWDKVSKELQILPSVAPRFQEPENETQYFYLGAKHMLVTCTVLDALPAPELEVFRDRKKLKLNFQQAGNSSQTSTTRDADTADVEKSMQMHVRFDFSQVQHGHQGLLECVAKNANKTVKRTVYIFVIDKPSIALKVTGGIVGLLCVVLAGLCIKQWYARRYVQRCQPVVS